MSAPAGQSPCRDCETGACPCGSTCEGCDFTGDCSSCQGTGFVEGPPPAPSGWGLRNRGSTGHRWGLRPPMPPCTGCGREHRCDTPYYGVSPDEVLRRVNDAPGLRDRPRCTVCCVPFGNTTSRWYQLAQSRGCASPGSFGKIRL